jgi:phosphocarrier protein HPr
MIPIKEKTMVTKKIIVQNRAGIHARPSSLIVQTASKFQSNIMFEKENVTVNAKSIMGVMTMAAGYQTELTVSADGVDEAAAVAALEQLFAAKFEEE